MLAKYTEINHIHFYQNFRQNQLSLFYGLVSYVPVQSPGGWEWITSCTFMGSSGCSHIKFRSGLTFFGSQGNMVHFLFNLFFMKSLEVTEQTSHWYSSFLLVQASLASPCIFLDGNLGKNHYYWQYKPSQ